MDYYLAIKRSEVLIYATAWMSFGNILLSKRKPVTNDHVFALTGGAQLLGLHSVKQRVISLILHRGTCMGYGFSPPGHSMCKRQPFDVSLPLFLPPFPSP